MATDESKTVMISMISNAETFTPATPIEWKHCTLERCNLVFTNGAAGASFIVHLDEMPRDLLVCKSAVTTEPVGTFVVGAEPFNPQENHTVRNTNKRKKLKTLGVSIYDENGAAATITNPFQMRLLFCN